MRRNIRTCLVFAMFFLTVLSVQVYAFFDDFEGDELGDDWQRSPAGQEASWSIQEGELVFNSAGGHSQMMMGEENWHDYTVECDIKLVSPQEWPGGIRTYVDVSTGGHYAVWFYPAQSMIKLYSGTAWDINTGLVELGEHRPFEPELGDFYHVKVVHQGKHIEVWLGDQRDDMELIIEADDDAYKSGPFAFDGWNQPIHFDNFLIAGPDIPHSPGEPGSVAAAVKLTTTWGALKQ